MKNTKKINKEELHSIFEGIAKNNEMHFNKLYEEITQKVFVKIWEMEKDKLPQKSEASWLYTLTKNETLNFLRSKKTEQNIDDMYYISEEDIDINKIIEQDSYNRIISKLDLKEQEIVSLKILSNLSFKQISQVLNISEGTAKWKYYKSMHTLKLLLGNLAMFIVTFVISIKTVFVSQRKESQVTDEVKENETIQDSSQNEEQKNQANSENHKEDTEDEIKGNATLENENQENVTQNVVIENSINMNDYYKIGILSASAIFLILTIIFTAIFTKHQLKAKAKTSK